ncbi:MAG TPA: Cof-type HAD-IIB family hydrolase [Clostridia bacterium]|nr:Cof-type HAD-IIB family hydrolase [Clostridia bacterium]
MIKLVAFDIDDTLTKSPNTVSPGNLAAIRRAREADVFVTLATGRGYLGSSYILKAVGVEGPVINYGGSVVNDTRTGKALYTASLKPEDVLEVFALSHELGLHAQLYQGDTVVYEKDNEYARRYMAFLSLPSVIDPQLMQKRWENVPKVIYITDRERAEELIPKLQKRFEGRLKVSGSKAGFVEFNDPGAHKGSALAWVADYLGIVRDEVAAMGDNLLDVEMLRYAGVGCAVADAHKEALEAADVIAPRCEDDGAAWFLDNVVLKGKRDG